MDENELARADLIALRCVVVAMVATHPDQNALLAAFDLQQQQQQASLEASGVSEAFLREVLRRQQTLRLLLQ